MAARRVAGNKVLFLSAATQPFIGSKEASGGYGGSHEEGDGGNGGVGASGEAEIHCVVFFFLGVVIMDFFSVLLL